MPSDRRNEREIRVLHGHAFKFFNERGIVRFPVRIKQIQFVWQTFLGGTLKDAANRRNPDATRDKHRRFGDIPMEGERSPGAAHGELASTLIIRNRQSSKASWRLVLCFSLDKHRRFGDIPMEGERSPGAAHGELASTLIIRNRQSSKASWRLVLCFSLPRTR